MALRLYFDLLSEPSRAVFMFLKLNNIAFEPKPIAIRKGAKINPFLRVPVVDDNGFVLTESVAILNYMAEKNKVSDNWYPHSDVQKRARVDEYLHWHHTNIRIHVVMLFNNLFLIPMKTGQPTDWQQVERFQKGCGKMVNDFEKYFLKNQSYLCGDEISVADLVGACEWMQLHCVNEDYLFKSSPVVSAWMDRVKASTQPAFDEAHEIVYRFNKMYKPEIKPEAKPKPKTKSESKPESKL